MQIIEYEEGPKTNRKTHMVWILHIQLQFAYPAATLCPTGTEVQVDPREHHQGTSNA